MKTLKILLSIGLSIFLITTIAIAMEYGTSEEAKAMLQKGVKAVKMDKVAALNDFTNGNMMYKEKDLYVFCFEPETGEILAHGAKASMVGKNVKTLKDKTGFPLGEELFKNAKNGEFRQVDYMWPRPGETEQSAKSSYVTRVEGLACGVGYYK